MVAVYSFLSSVLQSIVEVIELFSHSLLDHVNYVKQQESREIHVVFSFSIH